MNVKAAVLFTEIRRLQRDAKTGAESIKVVIWK